MALATRHVGVDFDNTLICYGALLRRLALERGLIDSGLPADKTAVRDAIRALPDGELLWQELQATAYGPAIDGAEPAEGVTEFFERCRESGVQVSVVSHKSEYASRDTTRTNLRTVALSWLRDKGSLGLREQDVYFEASRAEKVERIAQLACTHFVDDLPATLLNPAFPQAVEKLLYAPCPENSLARRSGRGQGEGSTSLPNADAQNDSDVRVFRNWKEISDYLVPSSN